jgi:hypothetical protein
MSRNPWREARAALVPKFVKVDLDGETLIGNSEIVEKRNQAVKKPKENKACDRWSS